MRLVAVAFLTAFVVGLGFLPAMFAWTFLAGDTATARVTACRHGKQLDCSGTWQDAKGRRGHGHISGVDESDIGRAVEVRIGPLGPYAGGPARSWPMLLTVLPLLLAPPLLFVALKRALGPAHALARRMLADPPGDAMLLFVPLTWVKGAIGVTDPDGRPRLSFATIDAPPEFRPAELPGRRPPVRTQSVFTAAAGRFHPATSFAAATDPGGSPVFGVERRGFADHEPETWLLDTGWTPQAVVRRVGALPAAAFELLHADGSPLGTMSAPPGMSSGAFVTRDAEGRQHAVMAAYDGKWVVRVEPGAPPLLRDLTLAFLLDVTRLQT
ncbi:MAG: hypothetical protein ACRDP6_23900 [Actinoallomurus sp.]